MSKLGKLLCIGSDDELFIEGLIDNLDTLGISYPDMSDVDATDTNEIIYYLMYEIRNDFEKAQALYPQRYIGGKECMCGILYRQAGNSIVVPVLQAILRELKQYF